METRSLLLALFLGFCGYLQAARPPEWWMDALRLTGESDSVRLDTIRRLRRVPKPAGRNFKSYPRNHAQRSFAIRHPSGGRSKS